MIKTRHMPKNHLDNFNQEKNEIGYWPFFFSKNNCLVHFMLKIWFYAKKWTLYAENLS